MFEVQVQGTFKKAPEGDLYISLEITQKMKLGLLTKVRQNLYAQINFLEGRRDWLIDWLSHFNWSPRDPAVVTWQTYALKMRQRNILATKNNKKRKEKKNHTWGFAIHQCMMNNSPIFRDIYCLDTPTNTPRKDLKCCHTTIASYHDNTVAVSWGNRHTDQ